MLAVFFLCCSGFGALALAMDRHHEDALGREPGARTRRLLQLGGAAALLFALALAIARAGFAMGSTDWCVQLSLGALAVTALATWWPRRLPVAASIALLGALASWALY